MSGRIGSGDDQVNAAKRALIDGGLLSGLDPAAAQVVRPAIERSWRRSVSLGVAPESREHHEIGEVDPDSRLQRAARPVARALMDQLGDLDVALVVADRQGQIVLRIAASDHLRRLDSIGAIEGFDFSEGRIGTNGLGTPIEEAAPVVVHGAEHFNTVLGNETCAGAPIRDPGTGRTVGTLSLTSPAVEASPLLGSLTVSAAAQIEHQLAALGTHRRQVIMRAFDRASAGTRGPIAVMSADEVFANTPGLSFLGPQSHAIIWEQLTGRDLAYWPRRLDLELPTGPASLAVESLAAAVDEDVFLIRFGPAPARTGARPSTTRTPDLHPDRRLSDALQAAWAVAKPLAVVGPAGSGKRFVSERLADRPVTVIDATDVPARWPATAAAQLQDGGVVLVRHVEDLPVRQINRLTRLVTQGEDQAGRLLINLNPALAAAETYAAVASIATIIELPALAGHAEWIGSYARDLVARSGRSTPVISAGAMAVLTQWSWPGNVAELRRVLREVAGDGTSRLIDEQQLPAALRAHAAGHRLGGLARSERDAIEDALRRCGGNRSQAADELGIGRTTLYRKIRTLKIDATS